MDSSDDWGKIVVIVDGNEKKPYITKLLTFGQDFWNIRRAFDMLCKAANVEFSSPMNGWFFCLLYVLSCFVGVPLLVNFLIFPDSLDIAFWKLQQNANKSDLFFTERCEM